MHLYEDYEKMNPTPENPTPTPQPNNVSVADVEAMKSALTESFESKLNAMQKKLDEFMKANNIDTNDVSVIKPENEQPNEPTKGE